MRNLKRALSLALAAAMLISLMVVGASAASYGDEASISQNEAVEVLTGIGVVGGDQNGNFNPTATLTRAEFCVMIANALTGGSFDQTLFDGTDTPFTDVAGHWGAGYIAYCYSNGIVAGTSATTFEPDGTLTAAQAAAILLMALGYNQNNEFAANGQFELNVTRWAQQAGLYNGMSVSANAGISRENTARLIFNALTNTTPVNYSSLAQSYYTVGTSAVSGVVLTGTQLDPIAHTGTGDAEQQNYTRTLGYTNFDLMKATSATPDDFGRPTSEWGVNEDHDAVLDKVISTVANTPVASFTAKTKAADVASALRGYDIDKDGTGAGTAYVAINNTTEYGTSAAAPNNSALNIAGMVVANNAAATALSVGSNSTNKQTVADAIAGLTANGKLVEVYTDTNGHVNKIVTVTYTVAKVTGVASNATRTTYTFNNSVASGTSYVDESVDDTISIQGTIAKGDIVTAVKPAGSDVVYVYPTTSMTGTQTAKNQDGSKITISGTEYSVGAGVTSVGTFNNDDKDAVYYIDQYGYVVETTSTAASTDYAFVIGVNGKVSTTVDGSTPAVEARVMLADGTVAVYNVKLEEIKTGDTRIGTNSIAAGDYVVKGTTLRVFATGDDSDAVQTKAVAALVTPAVAFGYSFSGDEIILETLAAASGSNTADTVYTATVSSVTKDTTKYTASSTDVLVDKNTQFVVYNQDKKTVTVYTGASGLPNAATGNGYAVLKTGSTTSIGTASVIFMNTAKGFAADVTDNYVYIDATKWSETLVDGETKYVYTGTTADGTTITLAPGDKIGTGVATDSGLYTYDKDNKVNTTKLSGSQYVNTESALTVTGELLGVGGNYYNITDETKIVYIKDDLAEVNGNKGFVVRTVEDGNVTSDVEAIFVTAD